MAKLIDNPLTIDQMATDITARVDSLAAEPSTEAQNMTAFQMGERGQEVFPDFCILTTFNNIRQKLLMLEAQLKMIRGE